MVNFRSSLASLCCWMRSISFSKACGSGEGEERWVKLTLDLADFSEPFDYMTFGTVLIPSWTTRGEWFLSSQISFGLKSLSVFPNLFVIEFLIVFLGEIMLVCLSANAFWADAEEKGLWTGWFGLFSLFSCLDCLTSFSFLRCCCYCWLRMLKSYWLFLKWLYLSVFTCFFAEFFLDTKAFFDLSLALFYSIVLAVNSLCFASNFSSEATISGSSSLDRSDKKFANFSIVVLNFSVK